MKKRILFGLVAVVMAVIFVACGKKAPTVEIGSAAEALNKVFTAYAEEEKFSMMGGDMNNSVMGEAGAYDTSDAESTEATLHISADLVAKTDAAASAIHAMNANTFTSAAFHLGKGENANTFATELKDSVLATQWMCGFPEKLVIFTINDEYVVYAVGAADLVEHFTQKVTTVFGEAAVSVVDQAVE